MDQERLLKILKVCLTHLHMEIEHKKGTPEVLLPMTVLLLADDILNIEGLQSHQTVVEYLSDMRDVLTSIKVGEVNHLNYVMFQAHLESLQQVLDTLDETSTDNVFEDFISGLDM